MPYLHKYPELKKQLIPDAKGNTDPDFRIDNVLIDGKKPTAQKASKNSVTNTISDAHKQADGIMLMIENNDYITPNKLYAGIDNKFRNTEYNQFEVYLKYKDEWHYWNKDKWKEFYKTKKPRPKS